ncbi:MAG: hypothetical protein JXQ87_19165 [Bacteroidia bacterium]
MNRIAWEFSSGDLRTNVDSAKYYLGKVSSLLKNISTNDDLTVKQEQLKLANTKALMLLNKGEYIKLYKLLHSIIKESKIANDTRNLAYAYDLLGLYHSDLGNTDSALFYLINTARLGNKYKYNTIAYFGYSNLGYLFDSNKVENFAKAFEIAFRAQDCTKMSEAIFDLLGILKDNQHKEEREILINYLFGFSEKEEIPFVRNDAYFKLINVYKFSNESMAIKTFKHGVKKAKQKGDKRLLAELHYSIASFYIHIGSAELAHKHLRSALNVFEKIDHQKGIMKVQKLRYLEYYYDKEYEKAIASIIEVLERLDCDCQPTHYCYLSAAYSYTGEFQKAKMYLDSLAENKDGLYYTAASIYYLKQKDFQQAYEMVRKALKVIDPYLDDIEKLELRVVAFESCKMLNKPTEALKYYEEFYDIEKRINAKEKYSNLKIYTLQDQQKADSLKQVERDRIVREQYESELNKKDRTKNLAIGAGLLLILLIGGVVNRNRYISKAKGVIEKEKELADQERKRSDELLLNILPAEVAEELKETGESKAQHFDQVSILFTDFKEFTQTAEKLNAKELVNEINTCFKAFDAIMDKYGIEKIKTIGDSYMAASGLGRSSKEKVQGLKDAANLVLAALEIQEFMTTLNFKPETLNFSMRAGIHTGPVVAGIVGVKKFQYDIWGDTVNTASRMESHGEVGKVNISEATYELLKDDDTFAFEAREEHEIKGKGMMKTFFVSSKTEV